jgi:hypothetical protein
MGTRGAEVDKDILTFIFFKMARLHHRRSFNQRARCDMKKQKRYKMTKEN